jgi:hypothetical protein
MTVDRSFLLNSKQLLQYYLYKQQTVHSLYNISFIKWIKYENITTAEDRSVKCTDTIRPPDFRLPQNADFARP